MNTHESVRDTPEGPAVRTRDKDEHLRDEDGRNLEIDDFAELIIVVVDRAGRLTSQRDNELVL